MQKLNICNICNSGRHESLHNSRHRFTTNDIPFTKKVQFVASAVLCGALDPLGGGAGVSQSGRKHSFLSPYQLYRTHLTSPVFVQTNPSRWLLTPSYSAPVRCGLDSRNFRCRDHDPTYSECLHLMGEKHQGEFLYLLTDGCGQEEDL